MKKKILVDLSILKHINCGLGQVALNYGKYFEQHYSAGENYDLYLLVPPKMIGAFGTEVNYISSTWWRKHFPFLIPKFDVWHSIHQLSRFRPVYSETKVVLTIHDFNFLYEKGQEKSQKYLKKIQRKIDRADKVICISNFSKAETERFANLRNKKVEVIYNGVEYFDSSNAKQPDFVLRGKPFFFSIGQIKRKKNFHVLLPLMKEFPDYELYLAGKSGTTYGEEIRATIESENITNVHLVGQITNGERIWLYKNCVALLFPSLFEGFGLPVIEAMYFGKPVFTTEKTSLKEIGGGLTYIWDNFEVNYMKEVLEKNMAEFQLSPMNAQRNIDYAKSFSYEKHMAKYMKIYTQFSK
ncbi:MAG: glycosyltransferase family 1 protein [Bacteroidota bacterium]|nr:glycosyltransferase family 1 protein [Bacteroidota bacterium]